MEICDKPETRSNWFLWAILIIIGLGYHHLERSNHQLSDSVEELAAYVADLTSKMEDLEAAIGELQEKIEGINSI